MLYPFLARGRIVANKSAAGLNCNRHRAIEAPPVAESMVTSPQGDEETSDVTSAGPVTALPGFSRRGSNPASSSKRRGRTNPCTTQRQNHEAAL